MLKNDVISFRLDPSEKELFMNTADDELLPFSVWVRKSLMMVCKSKMKIKSKPKPKEPKLNYPGEIVSQPPV